MHAVRTIAVINQKGGVGKTTTVVNLGAALAMRGHDVLLIDLDPQSQLTLHLGVEPLEGMPPQGPEGSPVGDERKSLYDVMTDGASLASCAVPAGQTGHLWVAPSVVDLAAAEMELVSIVGREQILADRLAEASLPYEYVLIDCPPSLGLLTLNALAAADDLLIPLQAHFLALQGLSRLLETVSLVQKRINARLCVAGVVLCMYDKVTRLSGEVAGDLANFFDSARGSGQAWADARVFHAVIRRNIKLAECPSYGKSIFDYEPGSHGAEDYGALADEFLTLFAPREARPEMPQAQTDTPPQSEWENASAPAPPASAPEPVAVSREAPAPQPPPVELCAPPASSAPAPASESCESAAAVPADPIRQP